MQGCSHASSRLQTLHISEAAFKPAVLDRKIYSRFVKGRWQNVMSLLPLWPWHCYTCPSHCAGYSDGIRITLELAKMKLEVVKFIKCESDLEEQRAESRLMTDATYKLTFRLLVSHQSASWYNGVWELCSAPRSPHSSRVYEGLVPPLAMPQSLQSFQSEQH